MNRRVIGILIAQVSSLHPFRLPEASFLLALCRCGAALGMSVFIFSPLQWDAARATLSGFVPGKEDGEWELTEVPLPDIVYDRCHYDSHAEKLACSACLNTIIRIKPFVLLNRPLPGKLKVYKTLADHEFLAPLLPKTLRFTGEHSLHCAVEQFGGAVFMKPDAGMQGKGALRIISDVPNNVWLLDGRTRKNRPYHAVVQSEEDSFRRAARHCGGSSYIIQPALQLTDSEGRPFDVRALIQKDGSGGWSITGLAIRKGSADSITSNLHGGGEASSAPEALELMFGASKAEQLISHISKASFIAAQTLEARCGRLVELGIDFGIEPDGRLWLLEVNSKPGRSSFVTGADDLAEHKAIKQPLLYARLLCNPVYAPQNQHTENIQEVHP